MYIQKIGIQNVRGFRDGAQAIDVDLRRPDGSLAGWTVLAGLNGSGKTSFLQSIALAVSAVSTAFALKESYAGWVRAGTHHAEAKAFLEHGPQDRFEGGGKPPEKPFWTGLTWDLEKSRPEPSLKTAHELNPKAKRLWPGRGPCNDNPDGWFIAGYGPFRRLTGHATDAQRLMVGPARVARLVNLFREDSSLVECVQWLRDVDYRSKEDRPGAEELKEAVLRLLQDELLPNGTRVDRIDSDGLWVRRNGTLLSLAQLSDGYRTMTALVLDLVRQIHTAYQEFRLDQRDGAWVAPHEGVVLIDEIDAHLHISWQQRIGFWLKRHFPNIQFIVTTHSPFICQAADRRGLIRLPAAGEDRSAEHVSATLFNTIVNGSVDEAAMTELFGLDRTHSAQSEQMRRRLGELEVRQIRGMLTPAEQSELHRLMAAMPTTSTAEVERSLRRLEGLR